MKLTSKEAEEARRRSAAYGHSMAIEGIHLTDEEKALFEEIHAQRMGYDEASEHVIKFLKRRYPVQEPTLAAE